MIKEIVIGSKNKAKIEEIKLGLEELIKKGIEVLDLEQLNVFEEPEEIGERFYDNALIKAKYYSSLTQKPTLSDDGGLEIPYLNNEPGVKSKLWLGKPATDEELIEYTLERMKNAKGEERKAYLKTCVLFYDPHLQKIFHIEEKISGYIAEKPSKNRIAGYPFRSLFIVEQFNKYYDELSLEEHHLINHRLIALKKLINQLKGFYNLE